MNTEGTETRTLVRPVYLDNAATTMVDPAVLEAMLPWLSDNYGNPASTSHCYGWDAEEAVEHARRQVAALVHADPREIVWTSGATESNNLALKGAAQFYCGRGKHIVTVKTEHKAVIDTCRELERQGYEVTYLDVLSNGRLDLDAFTAALRDDTIIASVMHVNNEIGVIQDIAALGNICRQHNVVFHVDAAQSAGKTPIDLQSLAVDLMSFSAHKVYGPKGVGALYISRAPRIQLRAQIHGGGHERGFRSGTLPTHQIVGMGTAFDLARQQMDADTARIQALSTSLWQGLSRIQQVHLNGDPDHRIPHNINISVDHVDGEALIMSLQGLAVSSGSACTSASLEPSYVLKALGCSDERAHSSLRISLGRFTTSQDIDAAVSIITQQIQRLRDISPLWEMAQEGVDLDAVQWALT